jgi:hypothetical protein
MKTADEKKEKSLEGPRRIYLPKARILSQDELGSLSEKENLCQRVQGQGDLVLSFLPGRCLLYRRGTDQASGILRASGA